AYARNRPPRLPQCPKASAARPAYTISFLRQPLPQNHTLYYRIYAVRAPPGVVQSLAKRPSSMDLYAVQRQNPDTLAACWHEMFYDRALRGAAAHSSDRVS